MACEESVLRSIADEVEQIFPLDAMEADHRDEALAWLRTTADVFRRTSDPVDPVRHLVSYFLIVDSASDAVLLGDHVKAGLWLPSGGHVEPGEHPADTVTRECREELGIAAQFHPAIGRHPCFITITDTVGSANTHNDVSLWFVLAHPRDTEIAPDPVEYHSVRWWRMDEVGRSDPSIFDPHMGRMLRKLQELIVSRD